MAPLTIPRLELLSTLLLAHLIVTASESLSTRIELGEPRCFTDSQVSLFWIKGNGKDWKPFVQHQVSEVRKLVPEEYWSHCLGKENPADIPSRGMTMRELYDSRPWMSGPTLLEAAITVPQLPEDMLDQCVEELKFTTQEVAHSLLTIQPLTFGHIVDIKHHLLDDSPCFMWLLQTKTQIHGVHTGSYYRSRTTLNQGCRITSATRLTLSQMEVAVWTDG